MYYKMWLMNYPKYCIYEQKNVCTLMMVNKYHMYNIIMYTLFYVSTRTHARTHAHTHTSNMMYTTDSL